MYRICVRMHVSACVELPDRKRRIAIALMHVSAPRSSENWNREKRPGHRTLKLKKRRRLMSLYHVSHGSDFDGLYGSAFAA